VRAGDEGTRDIAPESWVAAVAERFGPPIAPPAAIGPNAPRVEASCGKFEELAPRNY